MPKRYAVWGDERAREYFTNPDYPCRQWEDIDCEYCKKRYPTDKTNCNEATYPCVNWKEKDFISCVKCKEIFNKYGEWDKTDCDDLSKEQWDRKNRRPCRNWRFTDYESCEICKKNIPRDETNCQKLRREEEGGDMRESSPAERRKYVREWNEEYGDYGDDGPHWISPYPLPPYIRKRRLRFHPFSEKAKQQGALDPRETTDFVQQRGHCQRVDWSKYGKKPPLGISELLYNVTSKKRVRGCPASNPHLRFDDDKGLYCCSKTVPTYKDGLQYIEYIQNQIEKFPPYRVDEKTGELKKDVYPKVTKEDEPFRVSGKMRSVDELQKISDRHLSRQQEIEDYLEDYKAFFLEEQKKKELKKKRNRISFLDK